MKPDAMKQDKPSDRRPRPESHRRRLKRLLKEMLEGKVSIHTATEMARDLPALPYRRVVE